MLISFDLSTKTGYSVFDGDKLKTYGKITHKVQDYFSDVKRYDELPAAYPYNFIDAAQTMATACMKVVDEFPGSVIVTEHTEGSSRRFSQRLLEFIHYAFLEECRARNNKPLYLLNSDWRRQVRCYVSQWPSIEKWNSKIGRLKKKAIPTKAGAKVAKLNGKIVTRVDQKKLSILIANYTFGLELDDDDIADSINMGRTALELGLVGATQKFAAPPNQKTIESIIAERLEASV